MYSRYRLQVVLSHFNWFTVAVVTSGVSRQERRRVLQQFASGAIQVREGPTTSSACVVVT